MGKRDELKRILNGLMVNVSQSMHYDSGSMYKEEDGYYTPVAGTTLKIGRREEHLNDATDKVLELFEENKSDENEIKDIISIFEGARLYVVPPIKKETQKKLKDWAVKNGKYILVDPFASEIKEGQK